MRSSILNREYEVGDTFNDVFISDLHSEARHHDRELLTFTLNRAKDLNANIHIGGDLWSFILPSDKKRFTNSSSASETDDFIISAVMSLAEYLRPYAHLIKTVLCGNHETAVLKYHGIDPIILLLHELEKEDNVHINYLGYSGYVRFTFKYKNGKHGIVKDLYADHGKGGSAVVTKGAIDVNRMMMAHNADWYWCGHKHSALIIPGDTQSYLNHHNNLSYRRRTGFITGCFEKVVQEQQLRQSNGMATPYALDYGEERMRALQDTGAVLIRNNFISKERMITDVVAMGV